MIARLGTGPAEGDVAYALNTAFMGDGAVIEVEPGARPARPLHLVFAYGSDQAAAVFTRSLVTIGAGAAPHLFESHDGPDGVDYQVNAAVDLDARRAAPLSITSRSAPRAAMRSISRP